jgi:hypothetical protein
MRQSVPIIQQSRREASNKIRYKINELLEVNEIYPESRTGSAEFNNLIEICIFKLKWGEKMRQSAPIIQPSRRTSGLKQNSL